MTTTTPAGSAGADVSVGSSGASAAVSTPVESSTATVGRDGIRVENGRDATVQAGSTGPGGSGPGPTGFAAATGGIQAPSLLRARVSFDGIVLLPLSFDSFEPGRNGADALSAELERGALSTSYAGGPGAPTPLLLDVFEGVDGVGPAEARTPERPTSQGPPSPAPGGPGGRGWLSGAVGSTIVPPLAGVLAALLFLAAPWAGRRLRPVREVLRLPLLLHRLERPG